MKMSRRYKIRKYSPIWWGKSLFVPACVMAIIAGMALVSGEAAAEPAEETVAIVEETVETEPVSLGMYTITHYCRENYPHICNDGDASQTATGTTPTPGRTIAADPKVLPYGTVVIIDGHEYTVEDCGGAIQGNRIDILVDTHAEANELGIYKTEVFRKVDEYHGL